MKDFRFINTQRVNQVFACIEDVLLQSNAKYLIFYPWLFIKQNCKTLK